MSEKITADNVNWVVNDLGELGVEIFGKFFFLYKGYSLERSGSRVRRVGKREFGETQHPVNYFTAGWNKRDTYDAKLSPPVGGREAYSVAAQQEMKFSEWMTFDDYRSLQRKHAAAEPEPPAASPRTSQSDLCPECGGSGGIGFADRNGFLDGVEQCFACNGTGRKAPRPEPCPECMECGGPDGLHYPTCPQSTECRKCDGTGRFKSINPSLGVLKNVECDAPCPDCNGTGERGGAE